MFTSSDRKQKVKQLLSMEAYQKIASRLDEILKEVSENE